MAGRSFKTALVYRKHLLDCKAIYEEVARHLRTFLDTDAAPATKGIKADTEEMVVPQSEIEGVIDEINNAPLTRIAEELKKLDLTMVEDNEQPKSSKAKGKSKRPSKAKGKAKATRKAEAEEAGDD
jgi:hypothetical protein